jgi:MoaA/NifB/PqqE/SkfB family radical SAM enzyme
MIEKFSRPRKWKNTKFWLYVGGGVIGAIVLTSLIVYVYNFGVGPLCELLGRPCAGLNSQVDEKREENQKTVTIMKDNTEDIKKSINSLQKDIGKQRKALNLALKKFETMLTTDLPKMKNQIADRIILSKLIQKNIDLSRNLQKRLLNVEKAVIELKAKDITLAQLIKTGRRKFKSIDDDIDNLKEGIFAAQLSTLENKYRFVNKVVEINKFLPENKQISLKQPRPAIKQRVRFKDPQTKDKK